MSSETSSNTTRIVGISVIAGILAFLALKLMADYTTFPALILAIVIAILVGILLWIGFREDEDTSASDLGLGSASAASGAATAATTSTAATAAPAKAADTASSLMGDAGHALKADAKAPPKAAPAKKTAAAKPAAKSATAAKPAAKKAPATKKAAPKAAEKSAAAKPKPAANPIAKDGKPATLKKARAGGADDLKLLKGVGLGLEKTLNELGFFHFDQVAGWRKKEIQWVDDRLKFKGRIERDEWIKQAKVLAKGGTTEFSKRAKKG